jgi:hypothetical protein
MNAIREKEKNGGLAEIYFLNKSSKACRASVDRGGGGAAADEPRCGYEVGAVSFSTVVLNS